MNTEPERVHQREKRIKYTTITAILAKILAMLVPFITVRFALGYLGEEIYGLWNAILSFFSAFAFADLGLGSGLQTALSQAQGREDKEHSRKLVASTFFVLIISTAIIMFIILILFPMANWGDVMNAESDDARELAGVVVIIIVTSKLLNIPFSLVNRTQLALQEGYKGNLWQCAANVISIVLIIFVVLTDTGKISLIMVSTYSVVIVSVLNFIVYFSFQRKEYAPHIKYADSKMAKGMLKIGISFCMLSIVTNFGLSLDNFIVAKVSSLAESTTYSILYRAAGLISVGCGMLSAPLWGAFGEALERKDYEWVKIRCKKTAMLSLIMALIATLVLMVLGNILFTVWLGQKLEYSQFMLFGMCLLQGLVSFISPFFMVLNARGIVKKQILVYSIYTLVSVLLKCILGKLIGIEWIPMIGSVCYGLLIVPYVYQTARKEIKN